MHYPSPEQVFTEVSRVLQKGGQFYFVDITTNQQSQPQYLGVSPGGIRLYSPQSREVLGIESGFNCLGHYYLLGPVLLTIFSQPS